ncbi:MAG TPA: MerR family transcriptional regulator [Spirochaetota bacterium]|nr:MerR family transcriptional regulator [Spirochaetota bacterium]HOM88366.1 MerR family transcriptional regulator [Spirochaetota bacterium]HPD04193.1 MerR family transcriptional regulator [Spirochaetota bacterium]HRR61421.1 MerR family transcriptional regulator [Spirochaetota bacterium]
MIEVKVTTYSIGELAKLLEMSTRTIRYYEELGLLNSVKRIDNGRRIYTDDDVRRLKLIKRLKILGLTLSEMHELEYIWQIHKTNDIVLKRLLEILDLHIRRIDDRMKDLEILKNEIGEYKSRIKNKING